MNRRVVLFILFYLLIFPAHATIIHRYSDIQENRHSVNPRVTEAAILLKDGKVEKAKNLFQTVLAHSPKDTSAILGLADIAHTQGKQHQVKKLLLQALKEEPNNAAVQTAMGRFLYLSNEPKKALVHFNKAVDIDPRLAAPEIELANLYLSIFKNFTAASLHYERAVELDAQNLDIRFAYASVLSRLGKLDAALHQLEIARQLNPDKAYTYLLKATILTAHGKLNLALDTLDRGILREPNNIQLYWSKSKIYFALKEYDNALSVYQKILSLSPNHTLALTNIGLVYQTRGDFEQAEKFYKHAIKTDSTMALAYNNLAFGATSITGREDEALSWAQIAVNLQPDNPEFIDTLALSYLSKGQQSKAQEVLESLVKKFPHFLDAKYKLAKIYEKKGDIDSAVNLYKSILRDSSSKYSESINVRKRLSFLGH